MDLDSVSIHKHAEKELGQYPAILTSHLVNNPYVIIQSVPFDRVNKNPCFLVSYCLRRILFLPLDLFGLERQDIDGEKHGQTLRVHAPVSAAFSPSTPKGSKTLIPHKTVTCGCPCMWMTSAFTTATVLGFVFDCLLTGPANFRLISVYTVLGELHWRKSVKYEVIRRTAIVK